LSDQVKTVGLVSAADFKAAAEAKKPHPGNLSKHN
jgi:hypothetical protein